MHHGGRAHEGGQAFGERCSCEASPVRLTWKDRKLWLEAQDELASGWLEGTYEQDQLERLVGRLYVVSARFGIQQFADRCRAIDDYSASCVNAAYGTRELAPMGGVDELAGLARACMDGLGDSEVVVIRNVSGMTFTGTRHGSLRDKRARVLLGKTLDLRSAYRQFPTRPSNAWTQIMGIWDPDESRPRLYIQRALPFGAAASVHAFVTWSTALRFLGMRLGRALTTSLRWRFREGPRRHWR